jgi:anthranilate synthase component II
VAAKLLMIDNYDSFTFNLVQYFGELGARLETVRNDALTVEQAMALNPDAIVLSPGPCTPSEAGITVALIQAAAGKIPLLGVCLGHQAIGQAFGGKVVRATRVMHGKLDQLHHQGVGVFENLPTPYQVVRYHSLAIERASLPDCLEVTAETLDGEIMGVRHKQFPIQGVQFHPESIASEHGLALLKNFLQSL